MDSRLETILQHAILAPSGDNCQPWKFALNDDLLQVDLYNDSQRDTSLYNLKQRASMIAHGAALENICIAAPAVGLNCTCKLFPAADNPHHIASINFTAGETVCSPLFAAIKQRHTNREKYHPVKISDRQVEQWNSLASSAGQKIWVGHQRQQIDQLAKLLSLNDRMVFATPDLHHFLFEQIRWNDSQAVNSGDGLDIKTLGLNAMDKMAFKFFKYWGLVNTLNKAGFLNIIQYKSMQLLQSASAIAVVAIQRAEIIDYVKGGQLWQRLLLKLASEGLTAQPVAGLACLMQAAVEGLLDGKVTEKQLCQLLTAREQLLKTTGCDDSAVILTMFRIGKGDEVTRALRRPLDHFILP